MGSLKQALFRRDRASDGKSRAAVFLNGVTMKRLVLSIVTLLVLSTAEAYALPLVRGTEAQERYEQNVAQRFDPYPSVGFGPEVVGGRPREYLNPQAQVLQVQKRIPHGTVNRPFGKLFLRRAK
jgi:hypothetical protein